MIARNETPYTYFVTPLALGEKPLLLGERDGRPEAAPGGLCLTLEDTHAIAQLFARASDGEWNLCIPAERIAYFAKAFAAMHDAATITNTWGARSYEEAPAA